MSSLEEKNKPAASSDSAHDPALERSGPDGAPTPPPRGAGASGTPSAGDGGLHLQNAHFGALEVDESHGASGAAPVPSAAPRTDVPPGSSADPGSRAAGPSADGEKPQADDTTDSIPAQTPVGAAGNSQIAQGETFSVGVAQKSAPQGTTPSLEVPPQAAVVEEDTNDAPTDIELSNTTVAENAAGAVIGTLTTIDPDMGETFTYAVSDDRFEIVDGQLKLKDGVSLDHEGEPVVTVSVTVTDSAGHAFSESFTITVENVNEGPTDIALSNASVAENAAGAVIGTLTTVDPDAGDGHTYVVSDDRFEVVDGQLKLKDGVSLDYEAEPSVTVQVTTTDAGGLSHSENFTITVENVNEGPTDIALSNASVAENAAGAVIGTLAAVDPDVGDSHTYVVSDDRFEVVDGQLKLKDGVSLDHEAEPSVTVQVTATDAGGLWYAENFTIIVENVNEGPTDIALSNASVAENAGGAVIGTLSTVDPDAGDSHTYTVSDNRFEVVDGQLKLKDSVSLDHEAEPTVTIQVTTTDAGGLSYTEDFAITVENVNEGPTDIALSNASVAENAAGAVVGVLSTVDPDAGDSNTYTVSNGRFEVVDGQLKLKDGVSLDHEAEPNVAVRVTATDAGGLSYSENFAITVENVNEGPSDIALSNASVAENAAGAVIGALSTVDPDAGDSHSYTVSDARFEVVDGQLKLKDGVSLDHEGEPTVTVQVTATDAGGLSVSESFTINVENTNEGPSDIALSNATVVENVGGAIVGALTTTDPDAGDTHTYTVSDDRFEVVGGQLKLKDGVTLDHEAEPSVTVQVTATDAGGLSLAENFSITVEDANDAPTDIALSNTTVAENAAGAVVGALSTSDPDAGDSHTYTVSDDRVEVVGGQLKLKDGVALDHDAELSVTVQVTATDASGASLSESFSITVANVNEAPSEVELSNTIVAENAPGAVVGTLTTVDPDAGDSHSYTVSDARFEVVGDQLKLKSGVSLDHEALTGSTINLTVTSTDAGGQPVAQAFVIQIENFDDTAATKTLGTSGADVFLGTDKADAFDGQGGNDTLSGGAGNDLLWGGSGNDTLSGEAGNDSLYGGNNNDTISGGDGNDFLDGGSGNDTLDGGVGDDILIGGAGTDTLRGGDGSDTYRVAAGAGNDTYADSGATGVDTIVATGNNVAIGLRSGFGLASGIEEISSGGFANVSVVGGTGSDTLNFSSTTLSGIVKIDGGSGNDTITGSAGDDTIVGGAGNDTLRGGDGSDSYRIGTGHGFDAYSDTGASGVDTIGATANNVTIGLRSGFGPSSGIEEISSGGFANVSVVGGTGSDTLNFSATTLSGIVKIDGGSGNDTITGSAGDDTIVGGAGNDTLRGGDGSDSYRVGTGHGFDAYSDTGASGVDTIVATGNNVAIGLRSGFGPESGIEEISSTGFANVSIAGGTGNDTLNFSGTTLSGITKIDGGSGNDTITGSAADDTIVGGAGNDSLRGGGGSDTYQVGTGHGFDAFSDTGASGVDRVVATADGVVIGLQSGFGPASGIEEIASGGFANVSIAGSTGNDTLNFSTTTLSGITRIDGGSGKDTITGSSGGETIYGGAGNDTLSGAAGDDTIEGGAGSDALSGGTGASDTLSYAGSSAGVSVNLNTNTVSGGDAQGDTISGFENVTGSSYDDTIHGDANNNIINAGDGNDRVYSSWGLDTIDGGAGSDTIDLANFNGMGDMTMNLSQGLVYFTGYVAGADHVANFENASGTSGNDTFIGGSGDNVMTGAGGNDVFHFSLDAGHDTAHGGTGIDFIQIDTAAGTGGWMEAIASGSTPVLAAGDWLLQLDSGEAFVLHGSGAEYDFGGVHAGLLTAADGSEMQFTELEGLRW